MVVIGTESMTFYLFIPFGIPDRVSGILGLHQTGLHQTGSKAVAYCELLISGVGHHSQLKCPLVCILCSC